MRRNKQQFLLLGPAGQLGNALQREFWSKDIDCIVKTRELLDITNLKRVHEQIKTLGPSLVINATGYTDLAKAEGEGRQACWRTNTLAVDNLVKACVLNRIPLIHVSTAEVFGDMLGERPRRETEPLAPKSWYAQTKASGEAALLTLGSTMCPEVYNRGFRYWLIRTSMLFEQPFRTAKNAVYQTVSLAARKTGWEVPVPTDVYRSITYAPHLARAIAWLATHRNEVVSGVYHLCNQGYDSLYNIFSKLEAAGGPALAMRPATMEEAAVASGIDNRLIPRYSGLNCDKWHEIAPFKMPSMEEALKEFAAEWRREHR